MQNAALITNVLPEAENEAIARVWSFAAQAPSLSGDGAHVEMALYMLHAVLKHHVKMRTDGAILEITKNVLPMRMAAGQMSSKAESYWREIKGFLARPSTPTGGPDVGGNRKGLWATLFGK